MSNSKVLQQESQETVHKVSQQEIVPNSAAPVSELPMKEPRELNIRAIFCAKDGATQGLYCVQPKIPCQYEIKDF